MNVAPEDVAVEVLTWLDGGFSSFSRNAVTRPSVSWSARSRRAAGLRRHQAQRHVDLPAVAGRLEVGQLATQVVAGQDVAVEDDHRAVGVVAERRGHVADRAAGAERSSSST